MQSNRLLLNFWCGIDNFFLSLLLDWFKCERSLITIFKSDSAYTAQSTGVLRAGFLTLIILDWPLRDKYVGALLWVGGIEGDFIGIEGFLIWIPDHGLRLRVELFVVTV